MAAPASSSTQALAPLPRPPLKEDTRTAEERGEVLLPKLQVRAGRDAFSATFEFLEEDHTLGNALRHVLMQQGETQFCGYSVPHPSEAKMNVRLQMHPQEEKEVTDLMRQGLQDLGGLSTLIKERFQAAVEDHDAR